jgi:hypothetical protein
VRLLLPLQGAADCFDASDREALERLRDYVEEKGCVIALVCLLKGLTRLCGQIDANCAKSVSIRAWRGGVLREAPSRWHSGLNQRVVFICMHRSLYGAVRYSRTHGPRRTNLLFTNTQVTALIARYLFAFACGSSKDPRQISRLRDAPILSTNPSLSRTRCRCCLVDRVSSLSSTIGWFHQLLKRDSR